MKLRLTVLALLVAVASTLVLTPFSAAAAPQAAKANAVSFPVTTDGTVNGVAGTLDGTLTLTRFAVQNGQLVAIGTLTGTITDALGNVLATLTNQAVTLPVTATGTCQILQLDLGPLHLDLLGLVIDLNAIHLDITAQSGAGNLLGNLLCAVAGLLDGNGPLNGIARLLNQILGQL